MIAGVTMGDAGGVGPEILLKAFRASNAPQPGDRVRRFGNSGAL